MVEPGFWNPDRTIRSNRENHKPFNFAVFLASRTTLWEKSRDPCEPWSDRTVLRTVASFWSSDSSFFSTKFRPILQYYFWFFQIWNQMKGRKIKIKKQRRRRSRGKRRQRRRRKEAKMKKSTLTTSGLHHVNPSMWLTSRWLTQASYSSSLFRPHLHMLTSLLLFLFWLSFVLIFSFMNPSMWLHWKWKRIVENWMVGVESVRLHVISILNPFLVPTWYWYPVVKEFLSFFFLFFPFFLGSYYHYDIQKNLGVIIIIEK